MLRLSQTRMPMGRFQVGSDHRLHMRQEIFLRSRGACVGSHHLPAHHIATDNEGTGAVANVLKLASLHFSGSQRQSWVLTRKSPGPRSVHPCSSSVLPLWPDRKPAERADRPA